MWGDALAREDERVRQAELQQQQQQQQTQRQLNQYSSVSQSRFHQNQNQPPLPPSFQPPPPPPTQQPQQQQQQQPGQSYRYGGDNDYDDDEGDEDVGAMSTAVNIFASTASTIFSRGGAAAKQLAAQGQKAASQLAAAAAPPPIHPPLTNQAYAHQPNPQTQPRSNVVPETSMLETPETHHKPPPATLRISPSLHVPILTPQSQLIDQPTRHSTSVADSTRGVPQQSMRQRPPSPAEAFFGTDSPALAPQRNVHYPPPPFPQNHPPMPEFSANQPPPTSTKVSSHYFEPPIRVSPQLSFHTSPSTTTPMGHVSGPPPIAAQFFAASAPVPVTSAPCIEHIDSTPVLTIQQPPVASHIALAPPQLPPRSDSSRIAPQLFTVEAGVPASQPPPPVAKTQPPKEPPSNAPSQPRSSPASSAFPPPRPNPVSRLTPPSSPMSATSNRTLNFPVVRRTPVVLPRPKLPSPRTSPGASSKFGAFKLPTPAKKLPFSRPVIKRPTPVDSEKFDVSPTSGQEPSRQPMAPLSNQELSHQETKHETKATLFIQEAAIEPTKAARLLASGIEPEEAHALREESSADTLESAAISVPSLAVQELEILPEVPSAPSQPVSALNPHVAAHYLRYDHAEVSELPDPRLDAQEVPSTAISKGVGDVGALSDPGLVAEVGAASDVGGDEAADAVKAFLLPPLESGDEPPGEVVPDGGNSDLDMHVADPGELKRDFASSKEETGQLEPTTENMTCDNASSGEASSKESAYNVSASVPDAGASMPMEGLNRRHELGTTEDARLDNTDSGVVEVEPQGADPQNDETLPEGWSSQHDPATGKIYFYNSLTLETTWNRPFRHDIVRNEVDVVDQPSAPPEDLISVAPGKCEAILGESVDVDDQPPLSEDGNEITDPTIGIPTTMIQPQYRHRGSSPLPNHNFRK
ncbi:hypothetical protein MHU86_18379 [Fragilaria crotonensis]|nr:hypothetical protein MHU86_18379 [Fragilaria crotonensis]